MHTDVNGGKFKRRRLPETNNRTTAELPRTATWTICRVDAQLSSPSIRLLGSHLLSSGFYWACRLRSGHVRTRPCRSPGTRATMAFHPSARMFGYEHHITPGVIPAWADSRRRNLDRSIEQSGRHIWQSRLPRWPRTDFRVRSVHSAFIDNTEGCCSETQNAVL